MEKALEMGKASATGSFQLLIGVATSATQEKAIVTDLRAHCPAARTRTETAQ